VSSDGAPLPVAVHGQFDVQLGLVAAGEGGAEFRVESLRDGLGQRPRQHRQAGRAGGGQRGLGCPPVVGVAGDPVGVEHEQVAGVLLADDPQDVAGQLLDGYGVQVAVGVAVQLDPGQP